MTKQEIIKETVDFYSADINRRSIGIYQGEWRCMYNGSDGKKCAFSRCCGLIPNEMEGWSAYKVLEKDSNILLEQYRGHSKDFWNDIQQLHDYATYWTESGLSEQGQLTVEQLYNKYKD